MAFPTSPTNGQQANINGITYTYSNTVTAWTVSTSVSNTFVSINVSDNVNSGNVLATGAISATGNVSGGNLVVTGNIVDTGALTIVTGSNGNITLSPNGTGIVTATGAISTTGNISANNATFTSNQTLSYGTANGVVYLNGSKVLTTGSALVFDGTNLSVGATPAAWALTGGAVAQVKNAGFYGYLNNAYMFSNIYLDSGGNTKYIANGFASYYSQVSGVHAWFSYASGTAGNATSGGAGQAMTLDSSGNLGVGTSSPTAKLDAFQSSVGTYFLGGGGDNKLRQLAIKSSTTTNSGDTHTFDAQSGTGVLAFATTGVEKARIDTSGNLGIGTISPTSILTIGQGSFTAAGSNTTGMYTASGGGGLVVLTDAFYVATRVAGTTLFAVGTGGVITSPATYSNTSAGAVNMFVQTDGTFYRSTSSLKYKNNVQDATHGLADLLQLRPVTYEGKAETDAGKTFGGLIAEEVHEAGLTEFVQYAEDGTPDALAYGNMVSLCIKAIQEQQALITQLQADVAALKGA